jgi:hypothetical protein
MKMRKKSEVDEVENLLSSVKMDHDFRLASIFGCSDALRSCSQDLGYIAHLVVLQESI